MSAPINAESLGIAMGSNHTKLGMQIQIAVVYIVILERSDPSLPPRLAGAAWTIGSFEHCTIWLTLTQSG
jgi:hypothetical protein